MTDSQTTALGNILVVDDTPANLRLLSGMLVDQGYKVRSAPNGKLALMGAKAAPPDLILLDINMPDMNGYEVCTQLKSDPNLADIPVIFISALDQTEDKIKAFTLGGVDYITKPFQIEEVLARVDTHLTFHQMQQQLLWANRELQTANAELAASNADLAAFAHTVAHDLKSPLSAIIGFSSLLESRLTKMPEATVVETLARITGAGHKMRSIIDALLLLAKVRQAEVALDPLDMAAIAAEVMERFAGQLEETNAEVVLPETWLAAQGYAPWVEEIWANYIGNALKYGGTPPRIVLTSQAIEGGYARFAVQDNGPGLDAEAQAQVFTPFTRFHQERAEGHGLGLSIVQRIIDKLGGQVGVESTGIAGEGCTFWFTLPVAVPG